MSVLVTGGAGYIGSHMALELLDAGEAVVVLDNLSTGLAWAVPEGRHPRRGDVGDQGLVRARCSRASGVDAIIHFAGSIVVPDSVADPLGYYLNNTVKSRALIEMAVQERHAPLHLLLHRRRLRHDRRRARRRGRAARAHVALRLVQAHDRDHAGRHGAGARSALCRAALLQRGRRRPEGPLRPVDAARHPSHQGRLRDGARQAQPHAGVRHRLPDARRHLSARLHPCHRSDAGAHGGAAPICARAAPATSSTAAMAAGSRCWR